MANAAQPSNDMESPPALANANSLDPSANATRLEIQEILVRFAFAADHGDWDAFSSVFTPDAEIDLTYMPAGGRYTASELESALREVHAAGGSCQHLVRNPLILLHGNRATAISEQVALRREPSVVGEPLPQHRTRAVLFDQLRLTDKGWRIHRREAFFKGIDPLPGVHPTYEPFIEQHKGGPEYDTRMVMNQRLPDAAVTPGGMSLVEALDRLEMERLIHACAQGIDLQRWDLFRSAFSAAAVVELPGAGGKLTPEQYEDMHRNMNAEGRLSSQHLTYNITVAYSGDTASAVSNFINVTHHDHPGDDGLVRRTREMGLYFDLFVHADDGWRIARRTILKRYFETDEVPYDAKSIALLRDAGRALVKRAAETPPDTNVAQAGSVEKISPQELIDRVEIYRALMGYARGMDEERWHLLRNAFGQVGVFASPDAGAVLGFDQMIETLRGLRTGALFTIHGLSNLLYNINGEGARVIGEGCANGARVDEDGKTVITELNGHYIDELIRTPRGWRLKSRMPGLRATSSEEISFDSKAEACRRQSDEIASAQLIHL